MSNNDIANQIAFQEEEHQLIIVEGILDSLIEASEKDAKYKYNQARSYSGHDGDEKDNIQYWQSASNHDRKKSKYYKQFKDSPWNDLIDLTDNVFTLSENYRNSNQITEYCNSLFKMSVEPIGIDGEDILELNCDEAIIRAVKMYRKDNTKRYAIIHSGSSKMIRKCIPDSINKYCAFENVLPEKISVLSVDASKGLEFEGVVAITPGMNKSEKYVAFTRALDNLIVVNSLESK